MINIIKEMEERDDSVPDKTMESKLRSKKGGTTDTDLGLPEKIDHTRLWKREDFMEKAATELDTAKDGGKIKGYKVKRK